MITVVGIGADGWAGLGPTSRAAIEVATTLMGSSRQLDLIPIDATPDAIRELLPAPLAPALANLAGRESLCLLASGDPMLHGIGASLAGLVPPGSLRVLPAPSSISLAAARLGWPLAEVTVRSLVTRDAHSIVGDLAAGARLLLLVRDGKTPAAVAGVLRETGWAPSRVYVCANLGGPAESITTWTPADLIGRHTEDLVVLGVECVPVAGTRSPSRLPGLPDDAFDSDGALTRREVRAVVLAELRPAPGELLWDVGAGSGSIGIEWLRAEPRARAIAVEPREDRRTRIATNAKTLGAPTLKIEAGRAPEALAGLPQPQAIFVGGGLTAQGVLDSCWAALAGGGRLVATAVTIESETLLHDWARRVGGALTRLELSRADSLGSFTTWRPELPIVIWSAVKP